MRQFTWEPLSLRVAKWVGAASGVAGATLVALNIGVVGYGFILFLVSSVLWSLIGLVQREPSLVVLQVAFIAINFAGIYRWMIAGA